MENQTSQSGIVENKEQDPIDFKVSITTTLHEASDGRIQEFKQITLLSPLQFGDKTFHGDFSSDNMQLVDGQIYIAADDCEVEYNDEYLGEDIALIPMTKIHAPSTSRANQTLIEAMHQRLMAEISNLFSVECNLPLYWFD